MAITLPFDLYNLLVTTLSGSLIIFYGLAFLVIAGLAATFRMPNIITLVSLGLFSMMLAIYLGGIFVFILIILGAGLGYLVSRIFNR